MPPLGIDQRRQAVTDRFPVWVPHTLHGRLDEVAAEHGSRPFVITDERTLSYGEVAESSRRLADGLVALGVGPGDRVGLVMANFPEFAPLKFAVSRVGAIAVPFNYLYQKDELAYVLSRSRCRVLITMTGFAGLDYLGLLDAIAPGWDGPGAAGDLVRQVVLLSTDGRRRQGVLTVEELGQVGEKPGAALVDVAPTAVADILYTSGTTGSPKGVMVTHDAVLRTAYASALTRAYEDGRRILFSLPCYHMFGYVEGLLSAMFVGGAVILQTAFDPARYLGAVQRHRAADMLCVPTMAVALLEYPGRRDYDLSSLHAILCGAAPAPSWVWERVRDELGVDEIVTGYGMTECGGAMTLTRPEDPLILTSTTVGRPKRAGAAGLAEAGGALARYKTVDPVSGDDLPAGSEGELVSTGPTLMVGFFELPIETEAVLRDGWLRSGDLGVIGSDGYLRVSGRSKELYKSGGELVMPKEIEDLLAGHDEISQAYVIGLIDERWGEIGCAVVVRRPGSHLEAEDVISLCRQKLARFKVPKRVVFLDAEDLPRTPTGKVQKFRLVAMAEPSRARPSRAGPSLEANQP
jgi:fatty-acyl-CoA synthase